MTKEDGKKQKKRYVAGIDPGVNTGIAIYDRELKRIHFTTTIDFWGAIVLFRQYNQAEFLVIIEAPKKTRLYARHDVETGPRRREKIAANVGSSAREAELLAEGLELLGFEVIRQTPTRRKWTAEQLERYTGIKERTNQHVRDAIALCYGV